MPSTFTFENLLALYNARKKSHGENTYKHISAILRAAKPLHKRGFSGIDHEQSWRSFKGKNLEKLIVHIIQEKVTALGLKITNGSTLEQTSKENLSPELATVRENLLIKYGEFGCHLPDVDIIVYEPTSCKVIAILSSKVTLRERIAQSGYWKLKLSSQESTKHIRVYFITPDEDNTFSKKHPIKKGRAIVETELDGSYVLSETKVDESDKVKSFDKFIDDLTEALKNSPKKITTKQYNTNTPQPK